MFSRRSLLLSLAALPIPLAGAVAQPWWDEHREQRAWEQERERERRHAQERHEHWDERRAHAAWERQQRAAAQRDWERHHHHAG
jgi:hypothetical protein